MAEGTNRMQELKESAKEKLNRGAEVIKEKAKEVDDKVHNNPWPVIGGAFVTGILLGYILGKKNN